MHIESAASLLGISPIDFWQTKFLRGIVMNRAECEHDPLLWLSNYFPTRLYLPIENERLELVSLGEYAISNHTHAVLRTPRASGQTTLLALLALRAVLVHGRRFVAISAKDYHTADVAMSMIRHELRHNGMLWRDYPETVGAGLIKPGTMAIGDAFIGVLRIDRLRGVKNDAVFIDGEEAEVYGHRYCTAEKSVGAE